MNKARRNAIEQVMDALFELRTQVEQIMDEETEAFENLPDGLQASERGEAMESAIASLDDACESIESAIDSLQEAQG